MEKVNVKVVKMVRARRIWVKWLGHKTRMKTKRLWIETVTDQFWIMAGRVLLPAVSSRSARHLARSFNDSGQNSMASFNDYTEPLLRRNSYNGSDIASLHYQSIYDSTEFSGSLRNRREVMRKRLKSHFMTPYQKYKHRGRKPWKLLLQFLKLIVVTVQVF